MPSSLSPVRWMLSLVCAAVLLGCAGPVVDDGSASDEPGGPDRATDGAGLPPLHPAIDHLDEAVVTVTTTGGEDVEVGAKVATTDAERRRGLMEVEQLPAGTGMLFLFEAERDGGFWMWNTLIELDIAFADSSGVIHTVATMTPCGSEDPADCPITAPDAPYTSALEVPGGWFDEVGVTPGATMAWTEPVPAG